MTDTRLDRRQTLLRELGVSDSVAAEIIAADTTPYPRSAVSADRVLPLEDEPLVDTWRGYVAEARSRGVFDTLSRHLVQLRFPVRAGMSDVDG